MNQVQTWLNFTITVFQKKFKSRASGIWCNRLNHGLILQTRFNSKRNLNMNSQDLNSMSFTQLVPKVSNFLSKEDAGEDGVILTIKGFSMETVKGDDGDEQKVVMHFVEEGYKPMILNNTNSNILAKITGAATAGEARGKQIVVYDDITVSFGGKVTGGLRIKKVAGAPAAPRAAAKKSEPVDPFDKL